MIDFTQSRRLMISSTIVKNEIGIPMKLLKEANINFKFGIAVGNENDKLIIRNIEEAMNDFNMEYEFLTVYINNDFPLY